MTSLAPRKRAAIKCVRSDATDAHHHDGLAGLRLGGVLDGTPARHSGAADRAHFLERERRIDLHARTLVDDRIVGERSQEDEDAEVLATAVVSGSMVRDLKSFSGVLPVLAEVREPLKTGRTESAGGNGNAEEHVVTGRDVPDVLSDVLYDAGALMARDDGTTDLRVATIDEVVIGVAQSG